MTAAQVPAAVVLSRFAVYDDPWLAENGFFHEIDQPSLGRDNAVARPRGVRPVRTRYGAPGPG